MKALKASLTPREIRRFIDIIDRGREAEALDLPRYVDFLELIRDSSNLAKLQALQAQAQARRKHPLPPPLSIAVAMAMAIPEEELIDRIVKQVWDRLRWQYQSRKPIYEKRNLAQKAISDMVNKIMEEEIEKGIDKKLLKKIKGTVISRFHVEVVARNGFEIILNLKKKK